jgi:protein-S-isoprenylcysteine O-methyltransferase Ste14
MLEQYMSGAYGKQFEDYRQRTPCRLLPGVW